MASDKKTIGLKLQVRRKYLRLTQQEVADALSMNRVTYAQYEGGRNEIGVTDLPRIARVLRVPLDYFFEEDEVEPPPDELAVITYYKDLPPDQQELFLTMLKAVHDRVLATETPRGRKATAEKDTEPL